MGALSRLSISSDAERSCARKGGSIRRPGRVYSVCMARVNVYLPDELAQRARVAGVNISGVTQDALRGILAAADTDRWLDHLEQLPDSNVSHERVIAALDDARDDFGARSAR